MAPCPALAEVRVGHNDLSALPSGLGDRLRVLDVGGNPRLGRAAAKKGVGAALAPLAGKPWLRAVTLRGTALGDLPDLREALAAALPDLQILDDKRVAGKGARAEKGGGGAVAAAEARQPERKQEEAKEKKEKRAKKAPQSAAVGRLGDEEGLGAELPEPAAPAGPGPSSAAAAITLPPPPPGPPPTPHGGAAVKVLPAKARPARAGAVVGGAAAAALLAGRDGLDGVGGWG